MEVVVDTNSIVSDYWLRSKRWRLLLRGAETEQYDLEVLDSVVSETVKHYKDDLRKAVASLATARRQLGRLLPERLVDDDVDVSGETRAYESFLRDRLSSAGASFQYPAANIAEIAEAAIARDKPFKPDGSGLIDALIWSFVLERVNYDDVALISNNHKDFGGDAEGGLHQELKHNLRTVDEPAVSRDIRRLPSSWLKNLIRR